MLKPRSLTQQFEWVWFGDPAVNQKSKAFKPAEYEKTGDRKYLPTVEGAVPTVFSFETLDRRQYLRVQQLAIAERAGEAAVEAIAYGLRKVAPWDESGKALEIKPTPDEHGLGERVPSDALDLLFQAGGAGLLHALGTAIFKRSTPDPTSGQG